MSEGFGFMQNTKCPFDYIDSEEITELKSKLDMAKEVLKFYGYHKVLNDTCSKVHNGFGSKAREVLDKL